MIGSHSKMSQDSIRSVQIKDQILEMSSFNKSIEKRTLYKTEICAKWEETGNCKYGKKCQYAHGTSELRGVERHVKYKSKQCHKYHTGDLCPYGSRCNFVHQEKKRLESFEVRCPSPGGLSVQLEPIIEQYKDLLQDTANR
jgi:butyrate response factor 1